MKLNLITAHVTIGKSKEIITLIFHERDFDKIEGDRLFLKNDERVLRVSEETKMQIIYQFNLID